MYSTTEIGYLQLQRLTEAVDLYYRTLPYDPTEEDFNAWIASLDPSLQARFSLLGIGVCRQMQAFRHFYAELHSLECKTLLSDFMASHLSAEDYTAWLTLGN
ncbi:hypothetical protein [Tellurirhabdus rosea]|uniref:hypothetical protein n=1 Tax=Tellurirhabdus rosea TaxID=2674997 RepID=UPI00225426C9|nr:hypothetical protein [Tellurirhabdus rosea]